MKRSTVLKALVGAVLVGGLSGGCLSTVCERETPAAISFGRTSLQTTALVEAVRALKGTRVEAINGTYKETGFQAQCVMKGDGEKLTVVFLAPQMRLVTIAVTAPHAIRSERAPQIPAAFEPEYALVDLAFVNLPLETLRRAVAPQLSVEEEKGVRRIRAADGRLVAELSENADGSRRYRQAVFGYEYVIRSL